MKQLFLSKYVRPPKNSIKIVNKICALQVRITTKPFIWFKRVRFKTLNASLTVEAALVLPLMIFALLILMMPLKIMDTNRKMQAIVESVCKDTSQYAYSVYASIEDQDTVAVDFAKLITSGTIGLYAKDQASKKVEDSSISDLSFWGTDCMLDGETIIVRLSYKNNLPFSVFGLDAVHQTVTSTRRAWIGKDGGKDISTAAEDEEDDEIVYIGKSSTRYHMSASCHYLHNDISAVSYDSITDLRNSEGAKYHACARCGASATPGSTVYILPSGTSYHTSEDCTAINAYVKAVKKSTVEYLGACSYCGGE